MILRAVLTTAVYLVSLRRLIKQPHPTEKYNKNGDLIASEMTTSAVVRTDDGTDSCWMRCLHNFHSDPFAISSDRSDGTDCVPLAAAFSCQTSARHFLLVSRSNKELVINIPAR